MLSWDLEITEAHEGSTSASQGLHPENPRECPSLYREGGPPGRILGPEGQGGLGAGRGQDHRFVDAPLPRQPEHD